MLRDAAAKTVGGPDVKDIAEIVAERLSPTVNVPV